MSDELVYMNRDGILDAADCIADSHWSPTMAMKHLQTHLNNNAYPVGMLELAETLRERIRTAKGEQEDWSYEYDALGIALNHMENVHHWLQEAGYR